MNPQSAKEWLSNVGITTLNDDSLLKNPKIFDLVVFLKERHVGKEKAQLFNLLVPLSKQHSSPQDLKEAFKREASKIIHFSSSSHRQLFILQELESELRLLRSKNLELSLKRKEMRRNILQNFTKKAKLQRILAKISQAKTETISYNEFWEDLKIRYCFDLQKMNPILEHQSGSLVENSLIVSAICCFFLFFPLEFPKEKRFTD
jgi:hypothetical protein